MLRACPKKPLQRRSDHKVYLGACLGAMTPIETAEYAVQRMAYFYGLYSSRYSYTDPSKGCNVSETWILRNEQALKLFDEMVSLKINSPKWHSVRAKLCGVPKAEVDYLFHERREK